MRRGSKYYFAGCLAILIVAALIRVIDSGAVIEITISSIIVFIGAIIADVSWGDKD